MHDMRLEICTKVTMGLWLLAFAGCANPGHQKIDARSFPDQKVIPDGVEQLKSPLTLPRAIEMALTNSADLAILKSAVDVAIQKKKAAGDLADPELRMSYTDGTRDKESRTWDDYSGLPYQVLTNTVSSSSGFSTGIRFPIPHPWIRSARISVENANVNAADMDLKAAKWNISTKICRLFADIHYFESDVEFVDQLVDLYKENITLFNGRAQARQASGPDVVAVSQKYIQVLSNRDRVLRKLAASRSELASLIGLPAEGLILSKPGDAISRLDLNKLTLDQLDQKALVNRADLSALYWRRIAAQEACREARAARIPWFDFLQFSYANNEQNEDASDTTGLMPIGADPGYERGETTVWRADTAISIPIFSWWVNNTLALRDAEYRQVDVTMSQTVRKIYQSFQDTLSVMRGLAERQAKYDEEAGPVISDMRKVLDSLNKESGISPDQIIKIKEQILDLQRLKLEQDYEFRLGAVALEESLGVWLVPVETR